MVVGLTLLLENLMLGDGTSYWCAGIDDFDVDVGLTLVLEDFVLGEGT